ncbi:hypothetical protein [Bradyrhizobium genosp. P]|uniref:hypothetical protein n=1 Tax=Bradyrhizobium genosp. P TaxID=83641 RepID=UPI003CF9EA4B
MDHAFIQRLRDAAASGGPVRLSAHDFIRAVQSGLIEYRQRHGVSINGNFIGECAASIDGAAVTVD